MANHKSALKKAKQDIQRRQRNRGHRSRLRTKVKSYRKLIEAGDVEGARNALAGTLSAIDHSVKLGVLHDNAAARTKSRLTKALNRLASA